MAYSHTLFNSIDEVPMDDWHRLCHSEGEVFMDPRFIRSVEYSMGDQARYWYLIVYDERGGPAAAACIFLWRIDAAILAISSMARRVDAIRKWWQNFLFFKVLFLGLPVSTGQSQLRIRSDADPDQICRVIHRVLESISRRCGAKFVVLKEFSPPESERIVKLLDYGYLLRDSQPMNVFDPSFSDLDSCLEAFRSHYRGPIRRSLRKAEKAGIKFIELSGSHGADQIYTDKVHRLYEAILERAETRFEHLPAAFFREIARQFGDQAVFSFAHRNDAIVAFLSSLRTASTYHMLFIGVDDSLTRETHLYFATMYHHLDYALGHKVAKLYIGQNADDFKLSFGCYQESRHIFVRGRHVFGVILKLFASSFFPSIPLLPPKKVWRKDL